MEFEPFDEGFINKTGECGGAMLNTVEAKGKETGSGNRNETSARFAGDPSLRSGHVAVAVVTATN